MRRRKRRRNRDQGEDVNPMNYVSNMSDAMLVLAVGVMLALIIGWNLEGWNNEAPEADDNNAVELTDEDLSELDNDSAVDMNSENMERLGEVYYDPDTGTYYIIQD